MMRRGFGRGMGLLAAGLLAVSGLSLAAAQTSSERIAGTDRYLTAVEISKQVRPGQVGTVFVASGEDFPDAMVGGAIAGAYRYPVLLTGRSSVPAHVLAEIKRLAPVHIILLGGPKAISSQVEAELGEVGVVTRLQGANRYATAVMVSRWGLEPGIRVAYLASGEGFPDALAGGVAAARADGPVLLTDPARLSAETAEHLAEFKPNRIVILGGPNAVSEHVATEVAKYAPVSRLAGADRFGTSAAISADTFTKASTVVIASGTTFPDALSGTPLAAKLRAPVLLVNSDSVPASICTEIRRLAPTKVIGLGGASAVSDATLNRARDCATPPTMAPNPAPTPTVGPTAPPQSSGS